MSHPDPAVQNLINRVEALTRENKQLRADLDKVMEGYVLLMEDNEVFRALFAMLKAEALWRKGL